MPKMAAQAPAEAHQKKRVLNFRRGGEQELRERARQQAAVAELGQRALAGSDVSALMEEAVSVVTQVLEVEYCKVLELLPDGNSLLLRAGVGWKEDYVGSATVSAGVESQAGFTLLSKAPVVVEDLNKETRFNGTALLGEHGVVSGLSVLIYGREQPFGVLGAHSTQRVKFTGDDIYFLQAIANVLAAAIDRKRAEEALQKVNEQLSGWINELKRHNRESTLLNEMGDLLQTCVNAEEAYTIIAQSGRRLFPDESGALCVLSSSRNLVEAVASWGDGAPGERVFPPDNCWALRRGRVHLVEQANGGLVCQHLATAVPDVCLCVPMMAQGEALGVLHLESARRDLASPLALPGSLTDSQQRLAVTLAEHVALALANLKLRETLRNQSIRDSLTGLFNRRYMEESLERELRRAARKQRPLGILMIDLDHFKRFNDTYGHEAGDALLRELGAFLLRRTREEDIACRYGGEEFVVILPEASLAVTRQRAELLREEARHLHVPSRDRSLGGITISIGVAVAPEHGSNGADVLRAADEALYRAKAQGRDRAVVSESAHQPAA